MAMNTSPDVPPLSYPQLFSFQVSYAGSGVHSNLFTSSDDKKEDYRRGILEVDFYMETLFVQDRDRIFMSQSFSTLRNHVDVHYLDDCSLSIKFESEQWNITSQNIAEKTCIQHLLENFDIIGKHVRYATSLLGATLRTSHEEQEFQVSAPGSKTLSLISPDLEDFDSWREAMEASIEYATQAARAAGMATSVPRKKPKSRATKSNRVQWDNSTVNKDAQLLQSRDDTRSNVEAVKLNRQSEAEAVMHSKFGNTLAEECYSNNPFMATKQESRVARDARRQSRVMMCLETALDEMKIAVSKIRTPRLPGPGLWHKANLSPPRFFRGFEEHTQSRPDREGRHWQPSLGHNYVDALISPRIREPLESSQPLRKSWDSTSTVDTGASVPRVVWRSQTTEDLKSAPLKSREEEILQWRSGSYSMPQVSAKAVVSQPITTQQQRLAHFDAEPQGITSSDDEEESRHQPREATTCRRFSTLCPKIFMNGNGLVPEPILARNTSMPGEHSVSGSPFQPCSDMTGLAEEQRASLPLQQFASSGPLVETTSGDRGDRKSMVKSLDLRPSGAAKTSFEPQGAVISIAAGEPRMPAANFMIGENGTSDSTKMQSATMNNLAKLSERDVRAIADVQACADITGRTETGFYGRISTTSDAQRVPMPWYESEKAQPPPTLYQSMPSTFSSRDELNSGRKSLSTEDLQHGAAANTQPSQTTLSSQQAKGPLNPWNSYSVVQNSSMVVPKATLQEEPWGQYSGILKSSAHQEAGISNASAGEPSTLWESRVTSPDSAMPLSAAAPRRRLSQTAHFQGTSQSAETPCQSGPIAPPSRQHSQTLQYQGMTQELNSLNGHSSRRNSSVSAVSFAKVQLDHFSMGQFSVEANEALTRGDLASEATGIVPNTSLLRTSTMPSDPIGVESSDVLPSLISGSELLSRRQIHDASNRHQSYLQVGPDEEQRFSQQPAYPARRLSASVPENTADRASLSLPLTHYPLEREAPTHSSYGMSHLTNGGVMHDQKGAEAFAKSPTGFSTYIKQNGTDAGMRQDINTLPDNIGSSKCSEEAPPVQLSEIAELVNRLVKITAGDEPAADKANLLPMPSLEKGSLNANSLPPFSSSTQDPLRQTLERQVSMSRASGDAIPSCQAPQRYSYEPNAQRSSVQTLQTPYVRVSSSTQDVNSALNLQGFNLLGGNGASISGPITLKGADGEVIIIGKERRSSTSGLVAAQGVELVQASMGVRVQEEPCLQDPQESSRRASVAGDMGLLNGEGDAWSLAILKPGTPAQIFKFETASSEAHLGLRT